MKEVLFEIISNNQIARDTYLMVLKGDTSDITNPGQFVNIRLEGYYLRRPISVCDKNGNTLTLIYKVVGKGTEFMSGLKIGDRLDILTGLGNGYDLSLAGDNPLLIGGGVGVPPLYWLGKELVGMNKKVKVILGFNTEHEVFYSEEFKKLGCEVEIATVDGSVGHKGFVTDLIDNKCSFFYACGPLVMFKAVNGKVQINGQFSFESRMGCGFGGCMGCSLMTRNGPKRVCKEGPVFNREEIIWED